MKVLSGKEVIKILTKKGFRVVSQKGSHIKLKKEKNGQMLIVTPKSQRVNKRGFIKHSQAGRNDKGRIVRIKIINIPGN